MTPHVVLAHDNVGGSTGMGRVAEWIARTVLEWDWRLTVVAAHVHPDVAGAAETRRVPRARALPAVPQDVAWSLLAARALRRTAGDVTHVHIPALLSSGQIMTCHHLAQPAYEHGVRPLPGRTRRLRVAQDVLQRRLDDRYYRRRPPGVRVTFVSEFLRDQFRRRYGAPLDGDILAPTAAPFAPVTPDERAAARRRLGVTGERTVVGYMGGNDPRKGIEAVRHLAEGTAHELLVAGLGTDRLTWPGARMLGYVAPNDLIDACDVMLAPALFDAAPTAVGQALARGVPVVVRRANGWAAPIERHGAGAVWDGDDVLERLLARAAKVPAKCCREAVEEFSSERVALKLRSAYERVLAGPPAPAAAPPAPAPSASR